MPLSPLHLLCRDELPGLQQRLADYQSDLGKFKTLIEQLTAHREGLQAKVAKRSEELAALQAQLEAAKAETATLREAVAAQELSPADVQRMTQERARLDEAMAKASAHTGKMRKELWEAEMELSRTVVGLENAAQAFNSKAAALQLIPITAKNSNGIRCVRACVRPSMTKARHNTTALSPRLNPPHTPAGTRWWCPRRRWRRGRRRRSWWAWTSRA